MTDECYTFTSESPVGPNSRWFYIDDRARQVLDRECVVSMKDLTDDECLEAIAHLQQRLGYSFARFLLALLEAPGVLYVRAYPIDAYSPERQRSGHHRTVVQIGCEALGVQVGTEYAKIEELDELFASELQQLQRDVQFGKGEAA